jgi:hypothetical protein
MLRMIRLSGFKASAVAPPACMPLRTAARRPANLDWGDHHLHTAGLQSMLLPGDSALSSDASAHVASS